MELWIRSQDKKTISKANKIYMEHNEERIYNINIYDDYSNTLGTYETKERALEVLDEIQSYLIPKLHHVCDKDLEGNDVKVLGINSIQTMVYEMPKE